MRTLLKLARFKRGVVLMAKRMILVAGVVSTMLLTAPIMGYSEETVATIKVQQQMEDEAKASEEAAISMDDGRTVREKIAGVWEKWAVGSWEKGKEQVSSFTQEIIGTDQRLERKTSRIQYLEQENIRLQGKLAEKEAVYGLDLARAKACIGDLDMFLDGLQVK